MGTDHTNGGITTNGGVSYGNTNEGGLWELITTNGGR